jgi:hypothetical protein
MDLHRITMDQAEARRAFRAQRRTLRPGPSGEDGQLRDGYRAMSRGQQLISLSAAMRAAGLDEQGLPRLAICRSDAQWVYSHGVADDGGVVFRMDKVSVDRDPTRRVKVAPRTFPSPRRVTWQTWAAMVPSIPAPLRPSRKLSEYFTLWDVDWQLVPPEDPALLQHVGGDLYAVVAVWDLTPLERAVLSNRLQDRERDW